MRQTKVSVTLRKGQYLLIASPPQSVAWSRQEKSDRSGRAPGNEFGGTWRRAIGGLSEAL